MEFSDESDSEANTQPKPKEKTDVPKKRTTTRRTAKTIPDPPVEKVPLKRQVKGKKSNAVPRATSSEDDETLICQSATTRRGRTRRELSRAEAETLEEPDKMRTIEEEKNEFLDISIEQLRTSDNETENNPGSSKDIGMYFVDTKTIYIFSFFIKIGTHFNNNYISSNNHTTTLNSFLAHCYCF